MPNAPAQPSRDDQSDAAEQRAVNLHASIQRAAQQHLEAERNGDRVRRGRVGLPLVRPVWGTYWDWREWE